MMMPLLYRSIAATVPLVLGRIIFKQGDLRLSSGEALKKTNSV